MSNQQLTQRVFVSVPDAAFYKTVKQYAFWVGIKIFTVKDCKSALMNYTHIASKLNWYETDCIDQNIFPDEQP